MCTLMAGVRCVGLASLSCSWCREASLEALGISMPMYLHLYQPALAWQMHQLAWGANRDVFSAVMARYAETCNNTMVLQLIIDAFDPFFYFTHVPELVSGAGCAWCVHAPASHGQLPPRPRRRR